MRYLTTYKIFESLQDISELDSCFGDLFNFGFEKVDNNEIESLEDDILHFKFINKCSCEYTKYSDNRVIVGDIVNNECIIVNSVGDIKKYDDMIDMIKDIVDKLNNKLHDIYRVRFIIYHSKKESDDILQLNLACNRNKKSDKELIKDCLISLQDKGINIYVGPRISGKYTITLRTDNDSTDFTRFDGVDILEDIHFLKNQLSMINLDIYNMLVYIDNAPYSLGYDVDDLEQYKGIYLVAFVVRK